MIIANIWIGIPFNLVVLYSGLQGIPPQLYEAAALDGASGWQRFWRVTFPLLRPVSAITLLLGLVYTLKVFDIIWIMTRGGPADSSTTLRHLVLPAGLRQPAAAVRARRRGRQPADRHGARLRADLHPAPAAGSSRHESTSDVVEDRSRPGPDRADAVPGLLDGQRLVHPRPATCARRPPDWFPVDGTLDGYRAVLDQQLPYLGTSLLVGLGTVALTLAIAAPAGYSLAKLRPSGGGGAELRCC